jgi:DNA-binding transcriptional MerR regulator
MALFQTSINFDFPENSDVAKEEKPVKQKAVPQEPIDVDLIPKRIAEVATVDVKKQPSRRGRLKLSEMAAGAELIEIPDDEELFSKRYYSIGSVTEMFKVNHSLLRFWESEFDIIKPKKNGKGDRFFRPEDVKNLRLIYHLLRERKYTIEGAKEFLRKSKSAEKKYEIIASMKDLKSFLLELKAGL